MQPDHQDDPQPDLKRRAGLARLGALFAAASVPLIGCGGGSDGSAPNMPPPGGPAPPPGSGGNPPPPPPGNPPPTGPARTTVLNGTLNQPWGLAILPDGSFLVTERGGSMVIVSANGQTKSAALGGVPAVNANGQGGLLDVVLDPDFGTGGNTWVYFTYSEPGAGGISGTAVNRGRLDRTNNQLLDVSAIPLFRQTPKINNGNHFGSRMAFAADKTLFVTLGERDQQTPAQDLTTTMGKIVRINRDGTIPSGNPNMGAGAQPGIWSYGHRNPQGAAVHPTTGELWNSEHGPQGGDEINRVLAGRNYGWPVISWGQAYTTTNQWGQGTEAPGMEQPAAYWITENDAPWTPGTMKSSTAPAGMTFYTGTGFPEWQGNLFVGALRGQRLWRLVLNSGATAITSREALFASLGERIRVVRQGHDGWLYFITDSGRLYRIDRS